MHRKTSLFLIMLMIVVTGCAPSSTNVQTTPVRSGIVAGNFDIIAEDNSFRLLAGERFVPPFQSNFYSCYYNGRHPNGCAIEQFEQINTSNYQELLNIGGKSVRVEFDDNSPSLFGVLVLFEPITEINNPSLESYVLYPLASQSYEIRLSPVAIQSAMNGIGKSYEKLATRGQFENLPNWLIVLQATPLN